MEKFREFLMKQTSLHAKPATMWLLNEEVDNDNLFSQSFTSKFTDLKYFPNIRGKQKLGFRHKHPHLVSFIFISFVTDFQTQNKFNDLVQTITTMGNRRKDKFIFIGNSEDCLQQIFRDKIVSGLRKTYGYDYSTGNLLVEPVSFDPSGSMNKLEDPSQYWLYRIGLDESLPVNEQFDGTQFRMFWETSKGTISPLNMDRSSRRCCQKRKSIRPWNHIRILLCLVSYLRLCRIFRFR